MDLDSMLGGGAIVAVAGAVVQIGNMWFQRRKDVDAMARVDMATILAELRKDNEALRAEVEKLRAENRDLNTRIVRLESQSDELSWPMWSMSVEGRVTWVNDAMRRRWLAPLGLDDAVVIDRPVDVPWPAPFIGAVRGLLIAANKNPLLEASVLDIEVPGVPGRWAIGISPELRRDVHQVGWVCLAIPA